MLDNHVQKWVIRYNPYQFEIFNKHKESKTKEV